MRTRAFVLGFLCTAANFCAGCLSRGLEAASLKHEQIRDVTAFYLDEQDRVVAVEAIALHDGKGPPRRRLVLCDPAEVERQIAERLNSKFVVRDTLGRACVAPWAPEESRVVLPASIFEESYDSTEAPPRLATMRRIERTQFIRAFVQHPHAVESGLAIVSRRGGEDVVVVADANLHRSQEHPISPLVAFPTAVADVLTSPIQGVVHAYWWAVMRE